MQQQRHRSVVAALAPAVWLATATLIAACGQKGPLIAAKAQAASAPASSATAPLPPPEPLEPPIPGTAPR